MSKSGVISRIKRWALIALGSFLLFPLPLPPQHSGWDFGINGIFLIKQLYLYGLDVFAATFQWYVTVCYYVLPSFVATYLLIWCLVDFISPATKQKDDNIKEKPETKVKKKGWWFSWGELGFISVGIIMFFALKADYYWPRLHPEVHKTPKAEILALDIDGNGSVLVKPESQSRVWWDYDEDDFREHGSWILPADGFLALDINRNGKIESEDLFGSTKEDGLKKLARLNTNNDGKITKEDENWRYLSVWQDSLANGQAEPKELYTLDEAGITAIYPGPKSSNGMRGTFRQKDPAENVETVKKIFAVRLEYDDLNSYYTGEYQLDFDSLMSGISLRGYGSLPDLHIAMSMDNEDENSLLNKVQSLQKTTFEYVFNVGNDIEQDIEDILFRWAAAQNIPPDSRGPNIDARELAFLERFRGRPFAQTGAGGLKDPLIYAAADLHEAYVIIFNKAYAHLLTQAGAGSLFTGELRYNTRHDRITGITGLDQDKVSSLERMANTLETHEDRVLLWSRVARIIKHALGIRALAPSDYKSLTAAMERTGVTWDQAIAPSLPPHFKDHKGSSYAGRVLGMKYTDADSVRGLFFKARWKDIGEKQVVVADIVTDFLNDCCDGIDQVIEQLQKEGFNVTELTEKHRGDPFLQDMNNRVFLAKRRAGPYGINYAIPLFDNQIIALYVKSDKLYWAAAHMQR